MNLEDQFLSKSRETLSKESRENSKILGSLNKDSFELRKDLLILAGTIFGASIALATGKPIGTLFALGELFLFLSILSGMIILLTYLKAKEWEYAFSSKNSLETYLLLNRKRIDKFELESTESLISNYKKLIDSNQRGILYWTLKNISIEKWPNIFNSLFLAGVFFILASIIPIQTPILPKDVTIIISSNSLVRNPNLIIWVILTGLFFIMAMRELIRAKRGIKIEEINLGFSDLNKAYETTRRAIIEADKESHKIACISYFLATLTAIASLLMEIR